MDTIVVLLGRLLTTTQTMFKGMMNSDLDEGIISTQALLNAITLRKADALMTQNNWCRRKAFIVRDLVEADSCVVSYRVQLDRSGDKFDHSACTVSFCSANQVYEGTYKTKHVEAGCTCDKVGLEREESKSLANRPLQAKYMPKKLGRVPMVVWRDGQLEHRTVPLIGVEAARLARKASKHLDISSGSRCIAISHVWADGLGKTCLRETSAQAFLTFNLQPSTLRREDSEQP